MLRKLFYHLSQKKWKKYSIKLKKFKKVLIFQTGEPTHLDNSGAPMRLINLSNYLLKNNYNVEIITPRFFHQKKEFRKKKILLKNKEKRINYRFIESPGYQNNISIKRLYDHYILAKNLKKELKEIKDIDYVFMGYPPIEACFFLAQWCLDKKIPYIVDYKDLWPELFVHNRNFLFKILSFPFITFYKILRNYIIKNSIAVSTISNQFLNDLNKDIIKKKKIVCYLTKKKSTTKNLKIIKKDIQSKFPSKKIKIVFIGNFMTDAFDFSVLEKIKNYIKNSSKLEFYFFGSGPSKKKIENCLNFENVFIKDRVNSDEFRYIMKNSQAVFLPINNRIDYFKSLPNKIVDAVQYKLPIFTSLEGEAKLLINKFKIGFVYKNEKDLLDKLKWFCHDSNYKLLKKNYDNSVINDMFNHTLNYKKILDVIRLN